MRIFRNIILLSCQIFFLIPNKAQAMEWVFRGCYPEGCAYEIVSISKKISTCEIRFITKSTNIPRSKKETSTSDILKAKISLGGKYRANCCESTLNGDKVTAMAQGAADMGAGHLLINACRKAGAGY